jgi:membrane protein required for colicin V production
MVPHLSLFDIIVTLICIVLLVRGAWIGFSRQLAFLLALGLGFLVAGRYYHFAAQYFIPVLENERLRFLLAYALILFLAYMGIMLLGLGLKRVMKITFFDSFDRLLGGIFGLVKGVFFSTLLFMLLNTLLDTSSPFLQRSRSVPYLAKCARILLSIVEDEGLREKFSIIEPAIPLDLLPARPKIDPSKPGGGDAKPIPGKNELIKQRGT